ncbi:MAG: PAS domain S-box protein [Ignavibacteria bacterium]
MEYSERTKADLILEIKQLKKIIATLESTKINGARPNDSTSRALLDTITESILIQSVEGTILDLNITAAARLGKPREELLGKNVQEFFEPNVFELRKSRIDEAIELKKAINFQDVRNKYYFDNIIFPVLDNGVISKIIIFAKDITDRINAVGILRESEERYQELVDSSPYPIFIHLNERFVYSNTAGLKLLGYDNSEELFGKSIWDFVHPDYTGVINDRIQSIKDGARIVPSREEKLIKRDGTVLDVETIALPFLFKGTTAIQTIINDITDKKRIEWTLAEHQRMLSTLLNNLPGIAYRCKNDESWTMEFISEGCKELTGYSSSELINNHKLSYSDIIHPEYRRQIWDMVQAALNDKKQFELVYKIITSHKEEKWVWEKGEGVYDKKHNLVALEGFITDITEMKTKDERLRKLSRAVEQSPASIVITDLKGNIEYVNPKFTEITGYESYEVLGENPRILKSGENPKEIYEELWNNITSGTEWRGIFLNRKKDGSFFWESALISPVKNETGVTTHYLAVKEDITEQKLKDERLKNSLKEKELMLREIHHRVKNNLQIISSLLKLQATYITDESSLEFFRISQDRVKSMALIHQQLYRSNDLSSINFGDYLRNLTTHLFQAYGVNEGNIRLSIEAKNIYIGIDSAIPCGLLINELISNSLKHAFPGNRRGKINVTMEIVEENKFSLIISDNGIGFPEDIDFRNTKSLGMQLVITLTDQIDGRIELIRENGTTFKITFISINYKKRV